MKLISFSAPTGSSFGIIDGERIVDLGLRGGGASLKDAIARGDLAQLCQRHKTALADYHMNEVSFLPVIPNPSRILCAGLNYVAHRAEGRHALAAETPVIFLRLPQSQVGHLQPMICPRESEQFDFEAELAVIIGTAGRRIPEDRALDHIAGMSCYNDGSVRDWQLATGQWTAGKNFPATGAFGPWMVTTDMLAPDSVLEMTCRLNGQEMQRTTTDLMMFSIAQLIAHVSTYTTLEPGDVLVTGTPSGVGLRRDPPVWMKDGDIVEIEIDQIGTLINPVVKETNP